MSGVFSAPPRPLRLLGLLANSRRSPAAIRAMQEKMLHAMVGHAYRHVPFYRTRYRAAGINPDSIRSLDDLSRLPLVSKRDLLALPLGELLAEGIRPKDCLSSSSSGMTGLPLTAYWAPKDRALMNLSWKRAYHLSGMGTRDRMAVFIGRRQVETGKSWAAKLGFFPRLEISSWLDPAQWLEILRAWRPQVISGYVMTLRILAEFLNDRQVTDVRPRLVFNSSALLDDFSRRLFSRVFGCPIIDVYGSEEGGCIAWECPTCSAYHVAADMLIMEVLKDGRPAKPGETGEVVLTNLHSRAMPFIRYRQGDWVTLAEGKSLCGSPFPC